MKALLLLPLVFSPFALAETIPGSGPPGLKAPSPFGFQPSEVRPEKVAPFTARAAELTRLSTLMSEERSRVYQEAEKKRQKFNDEVRRNALINNVTAAEAADATPWISRYFLQRQASLQKDVEAFKQEVQKEIEFKRSKDLEKENAKREAGMALQPDEPKQEVEHRLIPGRVPPADLPAVPKQASAEAPRRVSGEVPKPVPSSVPGLPPGVEPVKKAVPALPPGMTKGK